MMEIGAVNGSVIGNNEVNWAVLIRQAKSAELSSRRVSSNCSWTIFFRRFYANFDGVALAAAVFKFELRD